MKLAIIGYGNLGKSLEREIKKRDGLELTAIYSRRTLDNPLYRSAAYIDKCDADVALIALGSLRDVMSYADRFAHINTVDSFDTHARIAEYKQKLGELKTDGLSIISAGWDPGLLSLARGIFANDGAENVTVWGEGVSQGHSNAIRAIDGVLDAVQFTVPKDGYERLIKNGERDGCRLHRRVCFVAAVENDKERIETEIKTMPRYFEGYDTEVTFVSAQEIRRLKERERHSGRVITEGCGFGARTEVFMESNADFTEKIMLRYAQAIPQLLKDGYKGALDVFDIPLRYIADGNLI